MDSAFHSLQVTLMVMVENLAIGISAESLGTLMDAGAVEVMYGSSSGLSATSPRPDQSWRQNGPDITATAGALDKFGWS